MNRRLEVIAFVILFLTVGYGFHQNTLATEKARKTAIAACARSIKGYDILHDISRIITTPTDLAQGVTNSQLIAQHDLTNKVKGENRTELYASLAKAPECRS